MKVIVCDKCGKPIPPIDHYTSGDIAGITINFVLSTSTPMGCKITETQKKDLDICPDCSRELKKILTKKS